MRTLNKIFPHIFYINLEDRVDRKIQTLEQLKRINTKAERFEGSNTENYLPIFKDKQLKGFQKGCISSHYRLISKAKEENYPMVFIFEDDMIIKDRFWERFDEVFKELPEDWEMFYLGGYHDLIEEGKKRDEVYSEHLYKCNYTLTTQAYVIKSKIYDLLLKSWEEDDGPIDVVLARLHENKIKAYCVIDDLVIQVDPVDNAFKNKSNKQMFQNIGL